MTMFWKWFGAAIVGVAFAACSDGESQGFTTLTSDAGKTDAQADSSANDFSDNQGDASMWSAFEQGELAIEGRGCSSCHQSSNPADGVLSGQTTPVPGTTSFGANLTPDIETGIGAYTDDQILAAIRTGVDPSGGALCAAMPQFPDVDDDEGTAILAYLRGIPPVKRAIPASECGDDDAGALDASVIEASVTDATASDADASPCASFVPPTESAPCHACENRPCQSNGCFGGYYCDTTTFTCEPESACTHDP